MSVAQRAAAYQQYVLQQQEFIQQQQLLQQRHRSSNTASFRAAGSSTHSGNKSNGTSTPRSRAGSSASSRQSTPRGSVINNGAAELFRVGSLPLHVALTLEPREPTPHFTSSAPAGEVTPILLSTPRTKRTGSVVMLSGGAGLLSPLPPLTPHHTGGIGSIPPDNLSPTFASTSAALFNDSTNGLPSSPSHLHSREPTMACILQPPPKTVSFSSYVSIRLYHRIQGGSTSVTKSGGYSLGLDWRIQGEYLKKLERSIETHNEKKRSQEEEEQQQNEQETDNLLRMNEKSGNNSHNINGTSGGYWNGSAEDDDDLSSPYSSSTLWRTDTGTNSSSSSAMNSQPTSSASSSAEFLLPLSPMVKDGAGAGRKGSKGSPGLHASKSTSKLDQEFNAAATHSTHRSSYPSHSPTHTSSSAAASLDPLYHISPELILPPSPADRIYRRSPCPNKSEELQRIGESERLRLWRKYVGLESEGDEEDEHPAFKDVLHSAPSSPVDAMDDDDADEASHPSHSPNSPSSFSQYSPLHERTELDRIRSSRSSNFCQCRPPKGRTSSSMFVDANIQITQLPRSKDNLCCIDSNCACFRDGVGCHVEGNHYCLCGGSFIEQRRWKRIRRTEEGVEEGDEEDCDDGEDGEECDADDEDGEYEDEDVVEEEDPDQIEEEEEQQNDDADVDDEHIHNEAHDEDDEDEAHDHVHSHTHHTRHSHHRQANPHDDDEDDDSPPNAFSSSEEPSASASTHRSPTPSASPSPSPRERRPRMRMVQSGCMNPAGRYQFDERAGQEYVARYMYGEDPYGPSSPKTLAMTSPMVSHTRPRAASALAPLSLGGSTHSTKPSLKSSTSQNQLQEALATAAKEKRLLHELDEAIPNSPLKPRKLRTGSDEM